MATDNFPWYLVPVSTGAMPDDAPWGDHQRQLADTKQLKRGKIHVLNDLNVVLLPIAIQPTGKGDFKYLFSALDELNDYPFRIIDSDWSRFKLDTELLMSQLNDLLPGDKWHMDVTHKISKGLVLYTDGSCTHTEPKNASYGYHGYTWRSSTNPTKFMVSGIRVTGMGYVNTELGHIDLNALTTLKGTTTTELGESVNMTKVVVGSGVVDGLQTNNRAELSAILHGLRLAKSELDTNGNSHGAYHIHLVMDSEYCLKFLSRRRELERKGWTNAKGAPLLNQDLLIPIHEAMEALNAYPNELHIHAHWTAGHMGEFGNEYADTYCDIGRADAQHGTRHYRQEYVPEAYFIPSKPRNPLLGTNRAFILTGDTGTSARQIDPDHCYYYLGSPGTSDDELGIGDPNQYMAIIYPSDGPDIALDVIRDYVQSVKLSRMAIAKVRNDVLANNQLVAMLENERTYALSEISKGRKTIGQCLGKVIYTVQDPPLLSFSFYGQLLDFHDLVLAIKSGVERVGLMDITADLYSSTTTSKGEVELKVEPVESFYVTWNHRKIKLVYGLHMPVRNVFGRIRDLDPKVTLVILDETDLYIDFAVMFECTAGWGMSRSVYASRSFSKEVKQ